MTNSNFMKMEVISSEGLKTLWDKGEIAHNEQFLFSPQCFQKTCTADPEKQGLVWERVKTSLANNKKKKDS